MTVASLADIRAKMQRPTLHPLESIQTVADACSAYPGLARAPAALLVRLIRGRGRVVSTADLRDELAQVLWHDVTEEAVQTTVKRLRQHIGRDAVRNQYGVGYQLVPMAMLSEDGLGD